MVKVKTPAGIKNIKRSNAHVEARLTEDELLVYFMIEFFLWVFGLGDEPDWPEELD